MVFFLKHKTEYEIKYGLVGSEMCIRNSICSAVCSVGKKKKKKKKVPCGDTGLLDTADAAPGKKKSKYNVRRSYKT
eukprot:NODE_29890_length_433_cov_0.767974.p1 GENE.NODE_29890_length_433_cov_0.767974~~NODE_29890_length_433_cov_0.767974.p1  ORF type:complete len:76 (+),score=4.97 NODE_29890_length_433_cov_0.767974:103-330(+)